MKENVWKMKKGDKDRLNISKKEIQQKIINLVSDAWENSYHAGAYLNQLPKRTDCEYDREIVEFIMGFKRALRIKSRIIYACKTEELIEYYYRHQGQFDLKNELMKDTGNSI